MSEERTYDLEARLVEYAVRIVRVAEAMPESRAGRHIGLQLLRSGTSAAPNYSEATAAESRRDFIHKVKIALKELREARTWLQIIQGAGMVEPTSKLNAMLKETDQMIAILFTSSQTARRNLKQ